MQAPLLGDVVAAALALRAVDAAARPALLRRLFADAETAWRHRLATARAHPKLGDGSLMTAALTQEVVREPGLADAIYCRCLAMVLLDLAERSDKRHLLANPTLSS